MNRFNVNLHPALFDIEKPGEKVESVEVQFERELDALKAPILNEFSSSTNNFLSEINQNQEQKIMSRYTEKSDLRFDQRRFFERINSEKDGKKYSDIWNENITQGFGRLISALKEKNYFKDKNLQVETAKIKDQYWQEVKDQYINNVWFAGNKKFNDVKDNLFGERSPDYPANKIYCNLIKGATTIFKVERQYTEGYQADVLDSNLASSEQREELESMSDRQNRNFVSNDLPMYLWNVKKSAPNWLKWIPLVTANIDSPSKEDRKAINKFIKASSRLEGAGNKDKALALMEVFHDSSLETNSGKDEYKVALAKHGLSAKDKYIDDIVRAGSFYLSTQRANDSVRDQHAIYLSVLKLIESEGGVKNTVSKFKSIVEQAKKDKKTEKKEGYKKGETLPEDIKSLAEKLGISDFTSATRLSNKSPEYFQKTPIGKILANINNDNIIDARDTIVGGSKSGNQFLEIFNQVGEDKALSSLLEHAKLMNKTLGLGLDESRFTKERIQQGDFNLILLLQNIIGKPGGDLYTLLSGHTENPFEGIDLEQERKAAEQKASEMISHMNMQELRGLGLQTPENIQTGLSAALFEAYTMGIGVGGRISFDEWVKGVGLNTGVQVRDDGTVVVGIGIDYSKKVDLGKGWSITPDLSAGAFIPIGKGKPNITASAGLNVDTAKERVTKNGVQATLGLQTGVTVMLGGAVVISGGLKWERDKNSGIEYREQEMKGQMQEKLEETLGNIKNKLGEKKLDFNNSEIVEIVKAELKSMANREGVEAKDVDNVVNATFRLLLNYNNADLKDENVRKVIAQRVAGQYAMSWAEARRAKITDSAYLASANLGAFWVVGTELVGIYGGFSVKKHNVDGYGDIWGEGQEIHGGNIVEWNGTKLDSAINQQLGLSDREKLKVEGGFVVLPQSFLHRVKVNPKMKGLMKKDNNGNVLLSTQTPISIDVRRGAATQGSEIIIGGNKLEEGKSFQKLDTLGDDWFTTGNINQNEVLQLGESIRGYTAEVVNQVLASLKAKFPEGDKIRNFKFENINSVLQQLNALPDKTKKGKIRIVEEGGKLTPKVEQSAIAGRGLEIGYNPRLEMFDSKAKEVANAVYVEALKVKNPRVLNSVKHDKPKHRPEYDSFKNAMQSKNYVSARNAIKPIFEKLDAQISGAKFTEIGQKLDGIIDNNALGQALMSINNIFARSIKVRGGGANYEFKARDKNGREVPVSMGSIIAEREGQISRTIENYNGQNITPEAKAGYRSLIEASAKYRQESKVFDGKMSAPAAPLQNTVGFNLGDKTNPENPLFNPEIYSPMVDLKSLESQGFDKQSRDALQKRTMELFAGNEALINPILKYFGLEGKPVTIKDFKAEGDKGKLILDIGGKKVTLSAGMKFGYFTQCVNHTVILDDISAETEDGTSVSFQSGVWEGGNSREGNKRTIDSTTEIGVSVSFTMNGGGGDPEKPEEPDLTVGSVNYNDGLHNPGTPGTIPGQGGGKGGTPGTIPGQDGGKGGTPGTTPPQTGGGETPPPDTDF